MQLVDTDIVRIVVQVQRNNASTSSSLQLNKIGDKDVKTVGAQKKIPVDSTGKTGIKFMA